MNWVPVRYHAFKHIGLVDTISILPTFDHELVDGSWTSRGRGLVIPCVNLSYNFAV